MRIEVVGRNVEVTDELRDYVQKRFARVAKQVSDLARLDVVLREEANPAIAERCVAEATLHVKGSTLHAEEAATAMKTAVREVSADIKRQVKRHRELRRKRSQTRRLVLRQKAGGSA